MKEAKIKWSEYMLYRLKARGFDSTKIEDIVRHSPERYTDSESSRTVVIGKHDEMLVMVPIEFDDSEIQPITVHATSRQQVNFRLRSGRFQL